MNSHFFATHCGVRLAVAALVLLASTRTLPAQPDAVAPPTETQSLTNALDLARLSLLLQEQLHTTQQAIERNRQESEAAAARNAELLVGRLSAIQESWEQQRTRDLDAISASLVAAQTSDHQILKFAMGFAGVGLVAFLLTALSQWRTAHRLGEIAAALPVGNALGVGRLVAALRANDSQLATLDATQQSSSRMIGAIERLEKRIGELENLVPARVAGPDATADGKASDEASGSQIDVLLGKGQSLLNLGQFDEALASFDEALALEADHTEALLKRGTALEKLDRLDEALASYDRAIAADDALTLAGSLFNRMARFNEALACYEQALKTQGKARAA
jgi:tetratricopeptide (TPR) repeat protein